MVLKVWLELKNLVEWCNTDVGHAAQIKKIGNEKVGVKAVPLERCAGLWGTLARRPVGCSFRWVPLPWPLEPVWKANCVAGVAPCFPQPHIK